MACRGIASSLLRKGPATFSQLSLPVQSAFLKKVTITRVDLKPKCLNVFPCKICMMINNLVLPLSPHLYLFSPTPRTTFHNYCALLISEIAIYRAPNSNTEMKSQQGNVHSATSCPGHFC